jgi:dTDP-4-amino-4,6-dideoxygalactose transaminase
MDPILEIAKKHGLVVIEDAAQAHGAEYKGRKAGSIGDMGCFSFYPGKNLGAYGEGGMVTTSNPDYTRTIRMLRDWGAEKKYQHVLKGYNYRLEGVQGAILNVKLKYLEKWSNDRLSHAKLYNQLLAGSKVETPEIMDYGKPVFHVYAVRTTERENLMAYLTKEGIQHGIHYPFPVHLLPAHADLGYKPGDFPESEKAANQVLSLPMFPELTDEQIHIVSDAVQAWSKA